MLGESGSLFNIDGHHARLQRRSKRLRKVASEVRVASQLTVPQVARAIVVGVHIIPSLDTETPRGRLSGRVAACFACIRPISLAAVRIWGGRLWDKSSEATKGGILMKVDRRWSRMTGYKYETTAVKNPPGIGEGMASR